jgi:hypothetical protein
MKWIYQLCTLSYVIYEKCVNHISCWHFKVKLIDINYINWLQTTCPSPLWVRIPTGTWDSFMWGSYPASLRNVAGSTRVPVRVWYNARKGTWGLSLTVKQERRDMTYTVSMWRKTQNKQTNKNYFYCVYPC